MSYYDVYIDGKPYRLYMGGGAYDAFLKDTGDGKLTIAVAKLSVSYDSTTNMVNCTIEDLSETGKRIKDQLRLEFEYKHGEPLYRNYSETVSSSLLDYSRPYNPDNGHYQGRHAIIDTNRVWCASPFLTKNLADDFGSNNSPSSNRTLSKNNPPLDIGVTVSYNLSDLFSGEPNVLNGNPRSAENGFYTYGDYDYYLDTRFYIRNRRTDRFLKTISPVLRLTYKKLN